MTKQALYGFTDYPMVLLGDTPGHIAPLRNCKIISYDRDKYVWIQIGKNFCIEIKAGYVYQGSAKKAKPDNIWRTTYKRFSRKQLNTLAES